MEHSTKLTIGTVVGFLSGLGLLSMSNADVMRVSNDIEAVVGGILAIISLYGFIFHHHEQSQLEATYEDEPVNGQSSIEQPVATGSSREILDKAEQKV